MAQTISTSLGKNDTDVSALSAAFCISDNAWQMNGTWELFLEIVMVLEDDIYTELERQIDDITFFQHHGKYS